MMADITNGGAAAAAAAGGGGAACAAVDGAPAKAPEDCRSGDVPHGEYHVAEKIGAGAYGAISAVYNDDGELFALKTFEAGDDGSADIGTLREISLLRLLRGDLAHPFVMAAHDFYISETASEFCMVMPKAQGSLLDVLTGKVRLEKNGGKPRVAHQLLSALAFLHDNGIMHRDVKPDNVLLDAELRPVLCDFSLAVFLNQRGTGEAKGATDPTHSGDVGTAVYMAPEVYAKQPYGVLCDAYSAGVVLLELFQGSKLPSAKDKQAQKLVAELRNQLPQRPIGALLRSLTAADPAERASCRHALETNKLMQNKGGAPPLRRLAFRHAMPDHTVPKDWNKDLPKKVKTQLAAVDLANPMTAAAAVTYYHAAKQVDPDIELAHCVIVASKLYEKDQFDLEETEDMDNHMGDLLPTAFDLDNYMADEQTIVQAMDFNLLVFP